MKLHFKNAEVKKLVNHTFSAKKHAPLYENPETEKAGLWLVGDQGVYLMSNGRPNMDKPEGEGCFVAYAKECDPNNDKIDWWENKRASFGGDDGCEFIELSDQMVKNIKDGGSLIIDISETQMKVTA